MIEETIELNDGETIFEEVLVNVFCQSYVESEGRYDEKKAHYTDLEVDTIITDSKIVLTEKELADSLDIPEENLKDYLIDKLEDSIEDLRFRRQFGEDYFKI